MISAKEVFRLVERASGFKDLDSRSKKGDRPLWRGIYFALACECTCDTLRTIGSIAGRDHSTVSIWRNTYTDMFISRPDMKEVYLFLKREIELLKGCIIDVKKLDRDAQEIIDEMRLIHI